MLFRSNIIYNSPANDIENKILSVTYTFNIGDYVWAQKYTTDKTLYKAQITDIVNSAYIVQFEDQTTKILDYCELIIYFVCDCEPEVIYPNNVLEQEIALDCQLLDTIVN